MSCSGWRQGFKVAWVFADTPSPQKRSPLGSPVKLAFRRFLFHSKFASLLTLVSPSKCLVSEATLANHSLLNKLSSRLKSLHFNVTYSEKIEIHLFGCFCFCFLARRNIPA